MGEEESPLAEELLSQTCGGGMEVDVRKSIRLVL